MNAQKIGQTIREARKNAQLSQDAIAALFGDMSRQAVCRWESGASFPDRQKWPILEQALNLPSGWFLSLQSGGAYQLPRGDALEINFTKNLAAAEQPSASAERGSVKESVTLRSNAGTLELTDYESLRPIGMSTNDNKLVRLVTVPVLGVVPAGIPQYIPGVMAEYAESYIGVPGVPPGSLGLRVGGNSMSRPDGSGIHKGDIVVFAAERTPEPNDVVVVNDDSGSSVLRRYVVENGRPYLDADNPQYERIVPNGEYRVVGVVIKVQRDVPSENWR